MAQSSKTVERGNENGGRGNGREHGTNDERGEIRISGERRGQTVQDSGRKGRSMEEGTGRTEENGRPGRYGRAEKENAGDVFKEAVTAKSLGIEGGTETGKAYILDESRYDDDIKALKEELGQFGLDVVAFEGSLTVENVGRVRGVISGNTVYVKTDAYRYNAYQIGMHEFYHTFIRESAKAEGISRELAVTRLWNRIVDLYDDDAEFENLAFEVYEKLYKDTGYSRERIIEEMLCDMFASMNELELFNVSEVFSQASQKKFYKSARRLMDIAGESLAAELRGSEYFDGFEQADEISGRSTGIDLQSRDRYSREMNDIIDGYLDSTNEKLVDFITRYNSSGKYERMSLISVTDRQKADIERLTGIDVSGYTNAINTNAIEHIERRHGKNGKSDSTMKDIHDVARVEFILENYDKVIISKKTDEVPSKEFRDKYDRPAPTLIFSKKINGTYYTVLAVPESSWKKIWIVSAFMDKKEDAISYAPDVQAPRLRPTTPRTAIASSDTQKISQSNKKSKKNFSDSEPRFSMETVDSDGNRLSEQQIEFFKDSKIRDEEGNLLRVYHGTDTSFTVFDKTKGRSNMDIQGMFFSPWELDAQGYGESVRAYYINIVNPAPEQTAYRALNKFKGQNNAGVKAREYLESLGYDGVNNSDEEYIAFNSNQIKLAENSEPTSDDDIRFSSENDEKLYRQLQDWLKGKGKAHGTYNGKEFDLGMTPKNLIDNGAKKSRLYMYESVIIKVTGGKHAIALEELAKIPSQLADPILLFEGSKENTLVALTEIKDQEQNDVIVSIKIKASHNRNNVTVVTSAYAKSDEYGNNKIVNYMLNQIKAGKLRDVSINKTSNWFTTVGRQLPSVVQTMLDDKRRLARQGKTVNTFNKNVTNNSDISSTKDSNDTRTSRETYTNISLERFKELEKNNKALEKRVKQLRKRTEHFKAELRQTPKAIKQNPLLDMSVCRKIADRLESGLGLMFDEKGSITYSELVQLIYDMGQANFQTDGWNEETTQKANETIDVLAKKAMEAAMEDTNEYLNEGLDKVKSYLKRIKIYVSPKLRAGVADFGKDYVKKYAGRIIFTYTYEKAYVNVEDVYSELNGMAPGLFPDEIINPS